MKQSGDNMKYSSAMGDNAAITCSVGSADGNSNSLRCLDTHDIEANDLFVDDDSTRNVEESGNGNLDVSPRFSSSGKFMHYETRATTEEMQDLTLMMPSSDGNDSDHDRTPKCDRKWAIIFGLLLFCTDAIILTVYLSGGLPRKNTSAFSNPTVEHSVAASVSSSKIEAPEPPTEGHAKKHTHAKKDHTKTTEKHHKKHTHPKKDHSNRPGKSSSSVSTSLKPEIEIDSPKEQFMNEPSVPEYMNEYSAMQGMTNSFASEQSEVIEPAQVVLLGSSPTPEDDTTEESKGEDTVSPPKISHNIFEQDTGSDQGFR